MVQTRNRLLREQKKQTRLNFQTLLSSSPSKGSYSTAVQDKLASTRYEVSQSPSGRISRSQPSRNSALPTPEPSSQVYPAPRYPSSSPSLLREFATSDENVADEENQINATDEEEDEVIVPSSKRRKLSIKHHAEKETPTRKSSRLRAFGPPSSDLSLRSRLKNGRVTSSPPAYRAPSIGSPESSGDDNEAVISKPTAHRHSTRIDDPFIVSDDEEEAIEVVHSRKRPNQTHGRNRAGDHFVVDDGDVEYASSVHEEMPVKQHRKSKPRDQKRSEKEQEELDEDLRELLNSSDEDYAVVSEEKDENDNKLRQTRGGPVTTKRDQTREHLEILRRRRAGERIPRVQDSDDDDVDLPSFGENGGADIDEIVHDRWQGTDKITTNLVDGNFIHPSGHGVDEEEDNFIDDDHSEEEEAQLSQGYKSAIPLAFTSFASSKPRELFVHIIEWLVKNKIAPAFSRDDELYNLSWNKVNDQITAQAGSRLISSAWNEDFKNAILARPLMQVNYLGEGDDELFLDCDACNKTNHPARYEFKFSGHAYHKDTLEPIDEEEDDDDTTSMTSYDQAGHLLPSSERTFNLGRFCAANAEMGHKLTHWKHHLSQSLLSYLEEQGVLSAEAILLREKLNKKRREKDAENVVDMMQETGVISELWQDLQSDLEDARFGMEDHVAKSGRRNQARIGKVKVNRGEGRIEEWSEGGRMRPIAPSDSE